jgi:hypothetical protein
MNIVTDAEFTDLVKNNAVKMLRIIQSDSGKYQVAVTPSWKEGEYLLAIRRTKNIREWASLETLARHIGGKLNKPIPISLELNANVMANLDGED